MRSAPSYRLKQPLICLLIACLGFSDVNAQVCLRPTKNTLEASEENAFKPDALEYQQAEAESISPEVQALETKFTPSMLAYEGEASEASARSLMSTMGRFLGHAEQGLAVVGPIFDVVALGLWTDKIVKTLKDKDHNVYDDIAAGLYLVPVASNIADIVAHASHLKTQVRHQIDALKTLHQYNDADKSILALNYTWRIQETLKAMDQNNQDLAFKMNSHFDQSKYQAMTWYHHLALQNVQQLEAALRRLEIQYFKHIYHELYKPPYQLERMHDLPYYTAECDASVMRSQHPQHQAMSLQKSLQACQDEINLVHLQPLIDLLQGQHPNFSIQQWITQTKALDQAKKLLIASKRQKLQRLRDVIQQKVTHDFQRYTGKLVRNPRLLQQHQAQEQHFKLLLLRHFIANEFSNIPMEQIQINVADLSFSVTHEAACSSKFRASLFYKIPGVYSTCQLMQTVSDWVSKPITVQFETSKSLYWQAYQQKVQQALKLLSADRLLANQRVDFVFKRSHTEKFHQYYLDQFNTLLQTCQRYDRAFVNTHYDCQHFLKASELNSQGQHLAQSSPKIGLIKTNTLRLKKAQPQLFAAYNHNVLHHGSLNNLVRSSIETYKQRRSTNKLTQDQLYPSYKQLLKQEAMHGNSNYLSETTPILPKVLEQSLNARNTQIKNKTLNRMLEPYYQNKIAQALLRMMRTHQDLSMQSGADQAANTLFAWQALLHKVTQAQGRYNKRMAAINNQNKP